MKSIFIVICAAMFLGTLIIPASVVGFDAEQLKQVKSKKLCKYCDLSGADLSGVDLSGADLSGTNFLKANLGGTNLSGANLRGASLLKANVSGTNLKGADLSGAIWYNASICKEGSTGECNTN